MICDQHKVSDAKENTGARDNASREAGAADDGYRKTPDQPRITGFRSARTYHRCPQNGGESSQKPGNHVCPKHNAVRPDTAQSRILVNVACGKHLTTADGVR